MSFIAIRFALLALSAPAASAPQETPTDPLKRLERVIEVIARGDDVESAAAARQLADLVAGPVAEAVGSLSSRPPAEELRIRAAVSRLSAELRFRLMRAGLPEQDRALLDDFTRRYEDLALQLFDDDLDVRAAALNQVPLAANTGAGILIAAKISDEHDDTVIDAAFETAVRLRDPVVARRLRQYVQDVTTWTRDGHLAGVQRESLDALAGYAVRAIEVIGVARDAESVPIILEHLAYFAGTRHWKDGVQGVASLSGSFPPVAHVALALGQIGDARATRPLLRFVDDATFMRYGRVEGQKITQTVGDTVVLSLARIHKIPFTDIGLLTGDDPANLAGFVDERARAEGRQKLAARLADISDSPAAAPGPTRPGPASQPSGGG